VPITPTDALDHAMAMLFKDARARDGAVPGPPGADDGDAQRRESFGNERAYRSLEIGKKGRSNAHDTDRPEWQPVLKPYRALVWSATAAAC